MTMAPPCCLQLDYSGMANIRPSKYGFCALLLGFFLRSVTEYVISPPPPVPWPLECGPHGGAWVVTRVMEVSLAQSVQAWIADQGLMNKESWCSRAVLATRWHENCNPTEAGSPSCHSGLQFIFISKATSSGVTELFILFFLKFSLFYWFFYRNDGRGIES